MATATLRSTAPDRDAPSPHCAAFSSNVASTLLSLILCSDCSYDPSGSQLAAENALAVTNAGLKETVWHPTWTGEMH